MAAAVEMLLIKKRWWPLVLRRCRHFCCCCCSWGNRGWASLLILLLLLLILALHLQVQSSISSSSSSSSSFQRLLSPVQQLEASRRSVLATDRQLRLLAAAADDQQKAEDFIHPNYRFDSSPSPTTDTVEAVAAPPAVYGPTMKTAQELVEGAIRPPVIDVKRPCGGGADGGVHLDLLVLVFCSAADLGRRRAIRETYGSALKANPQTELYFVLGQTREKDTRLEAQLRNESAHHNDLLQFAFTEDYYNLTIKSVAAVRWIALHCSLAAFTLKLDDDCFIRVGPLLDQLKVFTTSRKDEEGDDNYQSPPPAADLYGLLRTGEEVIRDPEVRYAVARRYWPYPSYPPLLAGVYLIRGGTTSAQLYAAIVSQPTTDSLPALPMEDAYITGVLAAKAGLAIADLPGVVTLFAEADKWTELARAEEAEDNSEEGSEGHQPAGQQQKVILFYETLGEEDLRQFWRVLGDG